MSYLGLLIYRCTIQRSAVAGVNSLGQNDVVWANLVVGVHCRPYPEVAGKASERETVHVTDVVSRYIMHMPKKTVVSEADRIVNITLTGSLVDAGPFDIELVKLRADSIDSHHLELRLKRVGPTAYGDSAI